MTTIEGCPYRYWVFINPLLVERMEHDANFAVKTKSSKIVATLKFVKRIWNFDFRHFSAICREGCDEPVVKDGGKEYTSA